MKDKFDNIRAAITNNEKNINLDLINESRKKTYREMLGRDNNAEVDLDDDMMGK